MSSENITSGTDSAADDVVENAVIERPKRGKRDGNDTQKTRMQ